MASAYSFSSLKIIISEKVNLESKQPCSIFKLRLPGFNSSKRQVIKEPSTVVRVAASNEDIDFSDPNWKQHYQEDFESRFNLPHLRDILDVKPRPTTFSLKNRLSFFILLSLFFFYPFLSLSPNLIIGRIQNSNLASTILILLLLFIAVVVGLNQSMVSVSARIRIIIMYMKLIEHF